MGKNKIIAMLAGIVIVGGGAFYAGTKYSGGAAAPAQNGGSGGRVFQRGSGGGAAGFVVGDIIAEDKGNITLRLRNGSSMIVFYSTDTKVLKSEEASSTDLTVGVQATIQGTPNSDGSLSAQSIQIRPAQATQQNPATGGANQ